MVIGVIGMLFFNIKKSNAQCIRIPNDSTYYMGFDSINTNEFYYLWKTMQDTNSFEASWTIYGDTNCLHSKLAGDSAIGISEYNKLWMFSRCFDLKKDTGYKLTFWYFVGMPDLPYQNLYVKVGNTQDSSSMKHTLLNLQNIENNDYQQATIIFTVPKDSTYNFGWLPYGNYIIDDSYMFIDDIALSKYVCDSLKPKITFSKKGICHNTGDSIRLDAGTGYASYEWRIESGELRMEDRYLWVKTPGQYTVTVTNASGCYGVDTVNIPELNLPNIKINTSTHKKCIYGNDSIELAVNNISGTGIDSIEWRIENGELRQNVNYLWIDTAGLYTIIVTDTNGCKGRDTVSIIKASNQGICHGSGNNIQANAGNGYASYHWSTGSNNELININSVGTYTVTLTGSNNYTAIDTINIADNQLPDITIQTATSKNYICGNDSLLLSINNNLYTMPLTYNWNKVNFTQPYLYAASAGKYTVTCTNQNGCKTIDSIHVFASNAPSLSLASQGDINICNNGSAVLKAHISGEPDSNYIFTWMPVDTAGGSSYQITHTGTFYYIATEKISNCSYTSPSNIEIINSPNQPEICYVQVSDFNKIYWIRNSHEKIKYYKIYKENVSRVFDSIGKVNYGNFGQPYTDILSNPIAKSAEYKISAVDSCGNESELSPYHKTMHLTISLGLNNTYNLIWEPYKGIDYKTYYILRDTSSLSGFPMETVIDSIQSSFNTYTDSPPGNQKEYYYIIGVSAPDNICSSDKSNKKNYIYSNVFSTKTAGINYLSNKNFEISIYPNPVSSLIVVSYSLSEKTNVSLNIYDLIGNQVSSLVNKEQGKGENKIEFNTEKLNNGIYFCKLQAGSSSMTKKIVVVH